MTPDNAPHRFLRDHVTGAIERWEKEPIVEIPATTCPTCKRPGSISARDAAKGYQCAGCTANDEGPC